MSLEGLTLSFPFDRGRQTQHLTQSQSQTVHEPLRGDEIRGLFSLNPVVLLLTEFQARSRYDVAKKKSLPSVSVSPGIVVREKKIAV